MKKDIHPTYEATTVTCACGTVIETRSTKKDIRVEICSSCHPYFTGKQKLIDTGGRVERFRKKYNLADPESDSGSAPTSDEAPSEAENKEEA